MSWLSKILGAAAGSDREPPESRNDPDLAELQRGLQLIEQEPQVGQEVDVNPADVSQVSRRFRSDYVAGRYRQIWERRLAYGYGVSSEGVCQDDLFWFQATPALAALHIGLRDYPFVATCCGLVEEIRDASKPEQVWAVDEFKRLYFGCAQLPYSGSPKGVQSLSEACSIGAVGTALS